MYAILIFKVPRLARINEVSHSVSCHPHVYQHMERPILPSSPFQFLDPACVKHSKLTVLVVTELITFVRSVWTVQITVTEPLVWNTAAACQTRLPVKIARRTCTHSRLLHPRPMPGTLQLEGRHSRSHRPIEQHFFRPWICSANCHLFIVFNAGLCSHCAVSGFPDYSFTLQSIDCIYGRKRNIFLRPVAVNFVPFH